MRLSSDTSSEQINQREKSLVGAFSHAIRNRVGSIIVWGLALGAIATGYQGRHVVGQKIVDIQEGTWLNKKLFAQESYRQFYSQWSELQGGIRCSFDVEKVSILPSENRILLPESMTIREIGSVLPRLREEFHLSPLSGTLATPEEIEKEFLQFFLEAGKKRIFEHATTFSQGDHDRMIDEYRQSHAWMGSSLDDATNEFAKKTLPSREKLPVESISLQEAIGYEKLDHDLRDARTSSDQKALVNAEKTAITRLYESILWYPWIAEDAVADSTLSRNVSMKHLNCNGKSAFMQTFLEKLGITSTFVEVVNAKSVATHQALLVTTSNGTNWYVDPTYGNIKNLSKVAPTHVGNYWKYPGLNDAVGQVGDEYLCVSDAKNWLLNAGLQNFAAYYYSHGYYTESKAMYEKALRLTGSNDHFWLAQSFERLGRSKEAQKHYRLSLKQFPENVELQKYLRNNEK